MGKLTRQSAMAHGWRTGLVAGTLLLSGLANAQEGNEFDAGMRGGQMVRGLVTAAAGDRVSIKTDAGDAYQVTVTPNTRIMKDRQPMKVAEIKPGDSVGAMGLLDAPTKTVHAMFVMVMDAEEVRKTREALGKSYIVGKITAIDELKLTILRPDNVSQVIAVDEGTSFKRGGRGMQSMITGAGPMPMGGDGEGPRRQGTGGGPSPAAGESITLADIKVGDSVLGKGELKSGTFVPTELAVMDPARQRRRRSEGSAASSATAPAPNQP